MTKLNEQMLAAIDLKSVSVYDMLVELRIALMDRTRWELKQFHGIDLSSQMLYGEGHWLFQCPSHKYKRVTQQLKSYLQDEEEEVAGRFSIARLLRVVRELAHAAATPEDHARYAAIDSVLTGGSDMHSQAAHVYVLICPQLIDALKVRADCSAEYVFLRVLGMAWRGWDMAHLTELERIRVIELLEALLIYNIGGEQVSRRPLCSLTSQCSDRLRPRSPFSLTTAALSALI
jgi:hypothetical protein